MGLGGGEGEGEEREPRGDTEWDMEDDEDDGVEDACDEEEAIEACPKREKRKLDRASLVT